MYKQKAMALSDLDETNFELEQEVLASSLESYRRQECGRKKRASPVGSRHGPRSSSPPLPPAELASMAAAAAEPSSPFASIPPAAAAAAAAPVASVPEAASLTTAAAPSSGLSSSDEEYPQTVQELVMNGFELSKVVHAYDLIGDNFDDLLAFLLSSSSSNNAGG